MQVVAEASLLDVLKEKSAKWHLLYYLSVECVTFYKDLTIF